MPAGVSWPRYLRMFAASLLAMFAGAQVVHQYYLPDLTSEFMVMYSTDEPVCFETRLLLSIPEVPPKPGELQTELRGYRIGKEAVSALQQLKAEEKMD